MSLEIKQLYKSFGSTKALDGMDFTVHPGELYGFVGSNGAGKTTTMRIVLGVLSADSGEVRIDGRPLTFEDRQNFGYMPEERGLYPKMTVGEQLVYFARLHGMSESDAKKAMEYWTDRLGVGMRRGDEVQALSLGNQQRVQLAAALVHDPDVLVLDEPFSGLDPLAVNAMSEVLREKADQGATVVFSSHQLDLVERLCDRVGIASLGKIAAEGPIDELRSASADVVLEVETSEPHALAEALRQLGLHPEAGDRNVTRVKLAPGASDQEILHAALALGPVHSFTHVRPSLTDLFGNIVEVPEPAQDEKKKPGFFARLFGGKKA
ncbi:ABC-2 type transport system ATP-binding protein [Trueperella bonasi]|uniref:ABC-2 type transport system ATP-binding protein n=1 Tax=Trueperella bonasi TaxID=312286 RepID=A0ABT9NFH9_9ACTO|nr:ATP-binding cassette domain-containing protein [Trueperella bonasi]MDP9806136.1 ABC-2 type transport system ATP-binding protein [Trueperella bonasi]